MTDKAKVKLKDLPVKVPENLEADVRADALHFKKSKDGIVEAALRHLFSLKREHRAEFYKYLPKKVLGRPIKTLLICLTLMTSDSRAALVGHAKPETNYKHAARQDDTLAASRVSLNLERLADAIRIEEGGNPRWLYGVHHPRSSQPLSEPEARRRCLLTLSHSLKLWQAAGAHGNPFAAIARRYCPANSKSWAKNVEKLYNQKHT